MKSKMILTAVTCLMAMTTQAQVITRETVEQLYDVAAQRSGSEFAYNAERDAADAITTLYVYRKQTSRRLASVTLQPAFQYQYAYDANGLLLSRTTLRWHRGQWLTMGRLIYTCGLGSYSVEWSRWNASEGQFDMPCDKMTYTLATGEQVAEVLCYHRHRPTADYELSWHVAVLGMPYGGFASGR